MSNHKHTCPFTGHQATDEPLVDKLETTKNEEKKEHEQQQQLKNAPLCGNTLNQMQAQRFISKQEPERSSSSTSRSVDCGFVEQQ